MYLFNGVADPYGTAYHPQGTMAQHNDEPCLVDRLDRGSLVHEVGEAVASCTPPQVFGIHGDWGLGKTSFLHQLHFYLAGECPQQTSAQIEARGRDRERAAHDRRPRRVVRVLTTDSGLEPDVGILADFRARIGAHRRRDPEAVRPLCDGGIDPT